MKKYYKLTNQKMQTYNGFQWKLGEWQEAKGDISKGLCSDAWLHCYNSPLLAVLHGPIHISIENPRLFEVEVEGEMKNDRGLKCGFRKMRLVKEIPLPKITKNQTLVYGILCAKEVYKNEDWNKWADNWLSGKNRNTHVASDAATAAHTVACTAHKTTVSNAHNHNTAAFSVSAANYASACAAYTAAFSVGAIYVASDAATAATYAAHATDTEINLVKLAKKAMEIK